MKWLRIHIQHICLLTSRSPLGVKSASTKYNNRKVVIRGRSRMLRLYSTWWIRFYQNVGDVNHEHITQHCSCVCLQNCLARVPSQDPNINLFNKMFPISIPNCISRYIQYIYIPFIVIRRLPFVLWISRISLSLKNPRKKSHLCLASSVHAVTWLDHHMTCARIKIVQKFSLDVRISQT